jgi:hypothetical protein
MKCITVVSSAIMPHEVSKLRGFGLEKEVTDVDHFHSLSCQETERICLFGDGSAVQNNKPTSHFIQTLMEWFRTDSSEKLRAFYCFFFTQGSRLVSRS